MKIDNNKIRILMVGFGLNEYESKVFLSLYNNGECSVNNINTMGNVPRSRIYDICVELERKGFLKIIDKIPRTSNSKFKPTSFILLNEKDILQNVEKELNKITIEKLNNFKITFQALKKEVSE